MLVLSRKVNEEIVIDGQIRVQVLQVKGKTIRLGISAPADVKILRGELRAFDLGAAGSLTATTGPTESGGLLAESGGLLLAHAG